MNMIDAVRSVLGKYAQFNGRSRRSEYWWFYLALFILMIFSEIISESSGSGSFVGGIISIVSGLAIIGSIIPLLAVQVRRLHDINKSGWNVLWGLLPIVGPILLIVWLCRRGTDGDNRFGPDPLAPVVFDAG